MPVGTVVTDATLARYVAALVVANDVSARQVQLVKTQFYEAKSYPTFTPAGPWLTLVAAADLARLSSLRLTLSVNGQVRQDSSHRGHDRPARPGTDPAVPLPATGPGRSAADRHARRHRAESTGQDRRAGLAGLLPPATRWQLFFRRQAANPRYLHDGDVITATIATPDGWLDLGTQRNTIIGKTP